MKKIACSLVLVSVLAGFAPASANKFTDKVENAWKNHRVAVISGTATPVTLGFLAFADIYLNQAKVLKAAYSGIKKLAAKAGKHPGYATAIAVPVILAAVFGGDAAFRGNNCSVKKGWDYCFKK